MFANSDLFTGRQLTALNRLLNGLQLHRWTDRRRLYPCCRHCVLERGHGSGSATTTSDDVVVGPSCGILGRFREASRGFPTFRNSNCNCKFKQSQNYSCCSYYISLFHLGVEFEVIFFNMRTTMMYVFLRTGNVINCNVRNDDCHSVAFLNRTFVYLDPENIFLVTKISIVCHLVTKILIEIRFYMAAILKIQYDRHKYCGIKCNIVFVYKAGASVNLCKETHVCVCCFMYVYICVCNVCMHRPYMCVYLKVYIMFVDVYVYMCMLVNMYNIYIYIYIHFIYIYVCFLCRHT